MTGSMHTLWCDERIAYDGSQLRAHWLLQRFGLAGDAIVAFRGPCRVTLAEMADLADVDGPGIAGDDMVHFVWECFTTPALLLAVHRQRLLAAQAREVLAELDFAPDPRAAVASLGFAERQLVAIAKGLRRRCRVFILDEPTAALEQREIARLFSVLARMQRQGTAIIYISHRLDEVAAIADRCTVLRDGRVAALATRGAFTADDLAAAMTGGAAKQAVTASLAGGELLLDTRPDGTTQLRLRAHEVVGLAGLLGSGTDRMMRGLSGAGNEAARVTVAGEQRRLGSPRHATAAGIGKVPGERSLGLIMNQSVRDNILLPNLDTLSRMGYLDRDAGDRIVAELMELVDIRPRQPSLRAGALSGGNQQKVILAKWLARRVAVLLLDDPTQGIDVAAKAQIHALMGDVVARGGGALIYSSDLGELARLCDRVLAVRQGRITASLDRRAGIDESKLRNAIGG